MEERKKRLYPVGLQDFKEIRERDCLYVDKTEYVHSMAYGGAKYYFLSRPRRFGKTLLTSTLQYYFEGRKELFEGLAIEGLEKEWNAYPVLRFDLSKGRDFDKDSLTRYLIDQLQSNEKRFGVKSEKMDVNLRLNDLIENVHEITEEPVVVLIDEYDAPLLSVAHNDERLDSLRRIMRNFFSPLKGCDPYLRFVFLTGITKFSQLSIFSELNNIRNISMLPEFAAICGITKEELTDQMAPDISLLADKLGITKEKALARLIENYDGYHFTWPSPDIFNPYSLLNAFADGNLGSYWFGSATPTHLIELMRKYKVKPTDIGGKVLGESRFNIPLEMARDYIPLFYQSGYLTIKDGDPNNRSYTLDIPNREVEEGLMESLVGSYLNDEGFDEKDMVIVDLRDALLDDNMDQALHILQDYFSTLPYTDNINYEGHYQQLLYIFFTLAGAEAEVEQHTAEGRIDISVRTRTHLYVLELKLDETAAAALQQIRRRRYVSRFAHCKLPVVKIGINFSSEKRNITDWKIEQTQR